MAISPPGDLVLDVVRAADPRAVEAANERLRAHRATAAGAAANSGAEFSAAIAARGLRETNPAGVADRKTYEKFEAMVLQNFVKTLLPDDSAEIFGEGTSGEIWKSMMAEQLANAIAARGGIGIADRLARYSAENGAGTDVSAARLADPGGDATRLVQQLQMNLLDGFLPSGSDGETS